MEDGLDAVGGAEGGDEQAPDGDGDVVDEAGEDDADYEADLRRADGWDAEAGAEAVDWGGRLNYEAVTYQDGGGGDIPDQEQLGQNNNGDDNPLNAVFFMIDRYGTSAEGITDNDGDTA